VSRAKKHGKVAFDALRHRENATYARNGGAAYVERTKPPPDGKARPTEVYGPNFAPRVKWSCPCGQRNDQALAVAAGKFTATFVCKRCKRASLQSFDRKQDEAAA